MWRVWRVWRVWRSWRARRAWRARGVRVLRRRVSYDTRRGHGAPLSLQCAWHSSLVLNTSGRLHACTAPRNVYEVITPEWPCVLYFDLEFTRDEHGE